MVVVLILEFTRAYYWRATWHTDLDRVKIEQDAPLRDKLLRCLPAGWTVEVILLSLGFVYCSYSEQILQAALGRFRLTCTKATELMLQLTAQCLTEADEIFNVLAAALNTDHAS